MRTLVPRSDIAIALIAFTCSLAAPTLAGETSDERSSAAQESSASDKYRAGTEAFEAQKYSEALALFRASYAVVASPNSHLMIARTLSKMNETAEAFAEFEATVTEAAAAAQKNERYKRTADAARVEGAELRKKLGIVEVEMKAVITAGGRPLPNALGGTIVVVPGKTDVVLRLPGGQEVHSEVDVQAGQTVKVDVAPPSPAPVVAAAPGTAPCPLAAPAPEPSGIDQRVLATVVGGVGVAGFATFTVFGLLEQKKYSDLRSSCPNNVCSSSQVDDIGTGRTDQALANVGLGVGIVGAIASAALFLTAPAHHATERADGAVTELAVGPRSMVVRGRF